MRMLLLSGLAVALATQAPAPTVPATPPASDPAVRAVRSAALPLSAQPGTLDPALRLIGDARVVMIGEATHGTHEFYRTRADLTRRLITERGFDAVIVEGDWPDTRRVNQYVRGQLNTTPDDALREFRRFPTWMWRNTVVRDFVAWLREHNDRQPSTNDVGFYGMDLYSLPRSAQAVIRSLETFSPEAARTARTRYACILRHGETLEAYGTALAVGTATTCRADVTAQLQEVQRLTATRRAAPGADREALLDVEQNARAVSNAEAYAVADATLTESSWNVRDRHMSETIEAIRAHLGNDAKVVVWAHNSHVGDARATLSGRAGELTLGQLARERHAQNAVLIGMTTHTGTVTATSAWDRPPELKAVRPSLPGSHERLFHDTGLGSFLLPLRGTLPAALRQERLERAIGVLYLPNSERESHYFTATLAQQFDLVLHFDVTTALQPLEPPPGWPARR